MRLKVSPLCTVVALAALFCKAQGQLRANSAAFNPLSGQGVPPNGIPFAEFPVAAQVIIKKLVYIYPDSYSFRVGFWWVISWEDPTAMAVMKSNYTSCDFYCDSSPSSLRNDAGQPACCDAIYIPQAEATTVSSFDSQITPYTHFLVPSRDGSARLTYSSYAQGDFAVAFSYAAYPWDKHDLCFDIQTSFLPVLKNALSAWGLFKTVGAVVEEARGVVADSQRPDAEGAEFVPGVSRPSLEAINLAEWQVARTWMEVVNFSTWSSPHLGILQTGFVDPVGDAISLNNTSPGVRVCIEVYRQTKSFYVVVLVLPIILIVLFSFGMFALPRMQLKARVELLTSLFLTLILLQFVLYSILPSSYQMIIPQKLVVLSYAYTFALLAVALLSHMVLIQRERRKKNRRRKLAKDDFKSWAARLQGGRPPLKVKEDEREPNQPHLKIAGPGSAETPEDVRLPASTPEEEILQAWAKGECKAGADEGFWAFRSRITRLYKRLKLLHAFAGLEESAYYIEELVQKFEKYARLILAIIFVACVTIICGVTAARIDEGAIFHTLPAR